MKRICRRKKRNQEKEKFKELNESHQRNETASMYRDLRNIKQGWQPNTSLCRDEEGNWIGEDCKIIKRWEEYFQNLLGGNEVIRDGEEVVGEEQTNTFGKEIEVNEPTLQDVIKVTLQMNNHKATGEDKILAELLSTVVRSYKMNCINFY